MGATTRNLEQWMLDAAHEYLTTTNQDSEDELAAIIASHAPSDLNRNGTVEYWMTRATTAELKLQEFAKVLESLPKVPSEAAAQPTCVGYEGKCEGNLPGESHAENCPLAEIEHNDH